MRPPPRRGIALTSTLAVAVAILGAGLVLKLIACGAFELPYIDIPVCYSPSSCLKQVDISDVAPEYARNVAVAWYSYNNGLKLVESSSKLCSSTADLKDISNLVTEALSSSQGDLALAMHHSAVSVDSIVRLLALIDQDLYRGGVQYTNYTRANALRAHIVEVLADLEHGDARHSLSKEILSFRQKASVIEKELASALSSYYSTVPYTLGKILNWPAYSVIGAHTLYAVVARVSSALEPGHEAVSKAVALHSSVYSEASALLSEYRSVMDSLEERANILEGKLKETSVDMDKDIATLRAYSLSGFTPDLVVLLDLPLSVREGVPVTFSDAPRKYSLMRSMLVAAVEENIYIYRQHDTNYIYHLSLAERAYERLSSEHDNLRELLSTVDDVRDLCKKRVKSYRPRSSYLRTVWQGYVMAVSSGDLSACISALELMKEDERYGRTEDMLLSCESRANKCFTGYSRAGKDVFEQYEHCRNFIKQRESELQSSEKYAQYLRLLSSIERMLSVYPDESAMRAYFDLPSRVSCESDLDKALSDALSLYISLKKGISKYFQPRYRVVGYLSTVEASPVELVVSLNAPGTDLEVSDYLPFRVLSYRVLESNSLFVAISGGNEIFVRGSGPARLWVLTAPYSLNEERSPAPAGNVLIRIVHDSWVPVARPYSGRISAATGLVHYDDNTIYFDGHAEVYLYERSVDVSARVMGDKVLVELRELSGEGYKGSVTIPYAAEGLSYCSSDGYVTYCRVNLRPREVRTFTLRLLEEANTIQLSDTDLTEEHGAVVLPSDTRTVSSINTERNAVSTLRNDISALLESLRQHLARAEDLNVSWLLPFSRESIEGMSEMVENSNDVLVLRSAYALLKSMDSSLRSKARAYVFALPEGDSKRVAETALEKEDYALALAVAYSALPRSRSTDKAHLLSLLFVVLSLALLIAYLRGKKPRRRRRIPKI